MLKQFQSLEKSTIDPSTKGSYKVCSETFTLAVDCSNSALECLATKNYDDLNTEVSGTITMASTCSEELSTIKPSTPELLKKVSIVENLSSIVLVILECFLRKDKTLC
ncbi:unnamed protein product [Arabidopsis halleri]